MMDQLIVWVFAQQQAFHRALVESLAAVNQGAGIEAGLGLIGLGFLYGVFHAAGPGHGKAILSAYLLTQRERLRRGVILAVLAALGQGLTAIVIVEGLVGLAGWLPRETSGAVAWSERASFALVAMVGLWLAWRGGRGLWLRLRLLQAPHHDRHHHHGHDHGAECRCGHAHAPDAEQIEQATSLRGGLAVILTIGLRPCSGAILVLVLAHAVGLAWAGVASVLAMSAGTAITVAVLAVVVVTAREWASQILGRRGGGLAALATNGVALAGGLLVITVGVSLLLASFGPAHPLGLR